MIFSFVYYVTFYKKYALLNLKKKKGNWKREKWPQIFKRKTEGKVRWHDYELPREEDSPGKNLEDRGAWCATVHGAQS